MFVLVTGPESSGTRWVSKLCARSLGLDPAAKWDGTDLIHNGTNCVMHRSLPHGNRHHFPNLRELADKHQKRFGGTGHIVVCLRDTTCIFYSAKRARNHNRHNLTRENMARAVEICTDLLTSDVRAFPFSYESAVFLRVAYAKLALFDRLGVPGLKDIQAYDGNKKYFRPLGAPAAKLRPKKATHSLRRRI